MNEKAIKPRIVVISGPSGSGKGTVLGELDALIPCSRTVSLTTRAPREGEVDGVDYRFVTREEFGSMLSRGDILEFNLYDGAYYGTPASAVDTIIASGRHALLDIDVNGALNVRKHYPDALLLFLLPPSADAQEHRLRQRGTNSDESIARRIATTRSELRRSSLYDGIIVNRDGEAAAAAAAIRDAINGILPDRDEGRRIVCDYFKK